ncbi:WD repeat-containing protein 60 [Collichthys lucidus]|uniref:WD repeat-containing protein 60 n=1 Tax=Collichthys lucidus TaxID=240159 RepID=A0A4U5VH89_COLLU|nr:WD repeat-containing protein 60 [Collichthys lucidus]
MHSDKKLTKEDTWRPADLRRHLVEDGRDDGRKHRGGESSERHRRDPEKEARRERDRYADGRKEDRDMRGDKERDRRDERDREKRRERDKLVDVKRYDEDYKEKRERRRDREERHERERDKERRIGKEKERHNEEERDKRREERDRERRREERERRRHEESKEGERDQIERHERERRDRHREKERLRDEYEKRNDKERQERHRDGKHWEVKEGRGKATAREDITCFEDEYEDDFETKTKKRKRSHSIQRSGRRRRNSHHKGGKEIEAIQRAMDEENERVGTAQTRRITNREENDRPKLSSRGSEKSESRSSQRGKFIDFVAAKQREVSKKAATKLKKRSTELLRLIDLDFSLTFSLLDLPPVNEYDMYIKNFGTTNTKQAYVQCNEDNADRDIQTEETEVCEKWTQHPPEHNGACGDPNPSHEARDKSMSEMNFDSQRLTAFLRSASQVMVVLLEEDQAERKSQRTLRSQTDTLSFSDGSLQLNTKLPFLYGRSTSLVHFSQVQRHTMMSVHGPTTKPSAVRLDSCTIICIWNIWEPSRPQKVLVYESEVQCCCFSPGKAILVFAGTSVGSVVLWDLREHSSNHYRLKIGEDEWTLRQPTFSTDAVMAGSGHFSSVTSVEVVPSAVAGGLRPEVSLLASEEESSGLSFQLASLDESGVLNFWVVVELPKANEAGSATDLGLRPGGKVKLLHSSSLLAAESGTQLLSGGCHHEMQSKTGPLQTLHLKFLPTDSNHFFIGTNMGIVNHGTSHGLKAPPKFYRFQEAGVRPVHVSSVHFSPFVQHLFLVGCGDGTIRLHAVSHEQPVAEWKNSTAGEPVVALQWAQTRPTVFCVLDAASNLHVWDLLKNDTEPVITERIYSDRVTAMALFGDSGQQNTYSGIALAHESGAIEMQYFARHFTVPCY